MFVGVREDLLTVFEAVEAERIATSWQWLLPAGTGAWFSTAMGDLFLRDGEGRVYWLAVDAGTVELVADSAIEFEDDLQDPENYALCFAEDFVDELQEAGLKLRPGECYSYRELPLLGGSYEFENFRVLPILEHFQTWGAVHERLKDIPEGAQIPPGVLPVSGNEPPVD